MGNGQCGGSQGVGAHLWCQHLGSGGERTVDLASLDNALRPALKHRTTGEAVLEGIR